MDRTTINIGPGLISWDSLSIHVESDIILDIAPTMFDVMTAGHGRVDARRDDLQVTVRGTPKMWSDLAKLFPYASLEIGASIYGGTDKPLTIQPRSGTGTGWVIGNAAITSLSNIILSNNKAILGETTWTGILVNNGDPADLTDYLAVANGAALSGFDLSKVPNGLYTGTWGTVLQDFYTEEGFEISFDMQTSDVRVDGLGVIDKTLERLSARCTTIPVGISAQKILDVHGLTTAPGQAQPKNDLVITGARAGMPLVTLTNCFAQSSQGRTGPAVKRIGELAFETIRTATNGVINPLWTFAAVE